MSKIVVRIALLASATMAGFAYGQTLSLNKYAGTWLTTDKSIKIILTPDRDAKHLDLAYFNSPDSATPYTKAICSPRGQADGIACDGGLWFALRSDGKLATNEEAHPPEGKTIFFLFEKVAPDK